MMVASERPSENERQLESTPDAVSGVGDPVGLAVAVAVAVLVAVASSSPSWQAAASITSHMPTIRVTPTLAILIVLSPWSASVFDSRCSHPTRSREGWQG
jgi:hypothetical protein